MCSTLFGRTFTEVRKKKKNIVLEQILVENYAAEGKSLARREGKVIFIEGAVPGDVVDVRLGKSKKDWAEGYPLRFHSYSKERAVPFCQHFGVCGGCQWQMLPYEKQLQFKHQQSHPYRKNSITGLLTHRWRSRRQVLPE
jgi:23S rRNA (uracil1939-C5)-methyltransferase